MADSHSSSASAKTPTPIAWAVMRGEDFRTARIDEVEATQIAQRLNDATMTRKYRVEPLVLASSLAELVADSARLDWLDAECRKIGVAIHDTTFGPPPQTRFIRRHGGSLRETLDAARSLPETTDNG